MLRFRSRFVRVALAAGIAAATIGAAVSLAAPGDTVSGRIEVIDGDSLRIGDVSVRLFGIDAPELAQTCTTAEGAPWDCGVWARAALQAGFGGRDAVCEARDTDRYGRTVARCTVDGQDVAAALVRAGIAEAYRRYSTDYVDAEKEALFARRGIWAGTIEPPWEFRARNAPPAQTAPVPGCAIKGNVSASGRIYHLPGQRDYAATRISPTKGERWFCSEAAARAAGWRPAAR